MRDFNQFNNAIINSKLKTSILIPLIEDIVNSEMALLEGNRIVNNDIGCLTNEQRITQGQLLLSLLRRHGTLFDAA